MAAPIALQCGRNLSLLRHSCLRYSSGSTGPATSLLKGWILPYLYNRFYDMESFIEFGTMLKSWNLEWKNQYYIDVQERYGAEIAAAVFALVLKGGVRFQGQTEWYREHSQARYSVDLVNFQGVLLEAIDLSGSLINYNGLGSLVHLKALKYLDLSRCPNVDDWSLSRLHIFRDQLEELSLAGCPQVTERGLGCLHHLESLRRLDVSGLPSVANKGLVQILLEEMLPQCEVIGVRHEDELARLIESDAHQGRIEEPRGAACVQKTSKVPA